MSFDNTLSESYDLAFWEKKEEEFSGRFSDNSTPMCLDTSGVSDCTLQDVFDFGVFDSPAQPSPAPEFLGSWPSLLPNSGSTVPNAAAFGLASLSFEDLGPYFASSQELYGGCTLESIAAQVELYSKLYPEDCVPHLDAWSGLLPNLDSATPEAATSDFPHLNSALFVPSFVSSEADTPELYAGSTSGSPSTPSESFFLGGSAPPPALDDLGISQPDFECVLAHMVALGAPEVEMCGGGVSSPVAAEDVLPPAPGPSTVVAVKAKKMQRAERKTRSSSSRLASARLTESKTKGDTQKPGRFVCTRDSCGKAFMWNSTLGRHERTIHSLERFFCLNPLCYSNTTKKPELGFNRYFAFNRHLLNRLAEENGEQHVCVLAAQALGWTEGCGEIAWKAMLRAARE